MRTDHGSDQAVDPQKGQREPEAALLLIKVMITQWAVLYAFCVPGIEVSIFLTSLILTPMRYALSCWSPGEIQGALKFRDETICPNSQTSKWGSSWGLNPGLWMTELSPFSKSQWPNLVPALVISSLMTRSPLEISSSPQAELLTFPRFYQAYFSSLLSHMWHSLQKMALYLWPLL